MKLSAAKKIDEWGGVKTKQIVNIVLYRYYIHTYNMVKQMIPIRCTGCGKVLGDLYVAYCRDVEKANLNESGEIKKVVYLSKENQEKTAVGHALDKYELKNECCRTAFITHTA
jgi:DNA-directed RNA polymerase subunit N (RpoN/RPB10)